MVDTELLAYLETFLTDERKKRFDEVLNFRTRFITIAVEDVFQMHNASAIVRTCDAFGIQDIHLIEGRFGKRVDKNIAMGAQQWVDIYSYSNSKTCINSLREDGFQIIATSPSAGSQSLEEFEIKDKVALFFGTEKEGLSSEVLKSADSSVQIPMVGFTESLNVSVSAAIILQSLNQSLRRTGLAWKLSDDEKLSKRLDWAQKTIKNSDEIIARYKADMSRSKTRLE